MTVPAFGNSVFANDQVKIRILEWALIQQDSYLYKKGEPRSRNSTHAGEVRVLDDASTSQKLQRLSTDHQKLGGEAWEFSPLQPLEGTTLFTS